MHALRTLVGAESQADLFNAVAATIAQCRSGQGSATSTPWRHSAHSGQALKFQPLPRST